MVLVADAFENSVVNQVVQALGEDVAGNAEASLEVIEAGHAEESIPDDEQAPPLPHDVEAVRDRTGDILETSPLHEPSIEGCFIERTTSTLSSMKELTWSTKTGA